MRRCRSQCRRAPRTNRPRPRRRSQGWSSKIGCSSTRECCRRWSLSTTARDSRQPRRDPQGRSERWSWFRSCNRTARPPPWARLFPSEPRALRSGPPLCCGAAACVRLWPPCPRTPRYSSQEAPRQLPLHCFAVGLGLPPGPHPYRPGLLAFPSSGAGRETLKRLGRSYRAVPLELTLTPVLREPHRELELLVDPAVSVGSSEVAG